MKYDPWDDVEKIPPPVDVSKFKWNRLGLVD